MSDHREIREMIENGETFLGIELGSTRIKAVLTASDAAHTPIAGGSHTWENRLENGRWTYRLSEVEEGLQRCFRSLREDVSARYGAALAATAAIGVSAMMHGYLPFAADGRQLAEFRTWRNTSTGRAAAELTELFGFNIPQRWSAAHLYQAMLDREEHVGEIDFLTTLAGYVHWRLCGERVLGVGDASGMFPIGRTGGYDEKMLSLFEQAAKRHGYSVDLGKILPRVLSAGERAGTLTEAGARFLDPSGTLKAGIPLCPPEGDAGTGMVATDSVAERTGNVSAGTSIFSMVVLESPLTAVYPEIDLVTTPAGKPVAMVHCNNCSSDIDAWAGLLSSFAEKAGASVGFGGALGILFEAAARGEKDCGGLCSCNYLSGEPVTGAAEGRPLFARLPGARFTLENFARSLLCSAVATLRIGMKLLTEREGVRIDTLLGHGGYFKTTDSGQRILSAALGTPISVMETAGEGGPWGMALLAAYMTERREGETLEDYLDSRVFAEARRETVPPDPGETAGFWAYARLYADILRAEKALLP